MAHQGPRPYTKAVADGIRRRIRAAVVKEFGSQTAIAKAFTKDTEPHRTARQIAATVVKQLGHEKSGAPVRDFQLATVIGISHMTRRNVAWILTGEGPEFAGETMARVALADAFADAAIVACTAANVTPFPFHKRLAPLAAIEVVYPARLLAFALEHVVATFQVDERTRETARRLRGQVHALGRLASLPAPDRPAVLESVADLVRDIGAASPARRVPIGAVADFHTASAPAFGRRKGVTPAVAPFATATAPRSRKRT